MLPDQLSKSAKYSLWFLTILMLVDIISGFGHLLKTDQERTMRGQLLRDRVPIAHFITVDDSPYSYQLDRYVHLFPYLLYAAHMLPALIWTLLAPIQFHAHIRGEYPIIHRWCGRLFLSMSCMLVLSAITMVIRGVTFSIPTPTSTYEFVSLTNTVIVVMATYFAYQGWMAFHTIREGDVAGHKSHMVRHVIMGHSVTVMRVVIMVRTMVERYPKWEEQTIEKWAWKQRIFFGQSMWLAAMSCLIAGEMGVRLMGWEARAGDKLQHKSQ